MVGGKGKVTEDDGSFDREFWRQATPEGRMAAMFHLRTLYHEVMRPGIGAKRLDRSVGGTRRLGDWISRSPGSDYEEQIRSRHRRQQGHRL